MASFGFFKNVRLQATKQHDALTNTFGIRDAVLEGARYTCVRNAAAKQMLYELITT